MDTHIAIYNKGLVARKRSRGNIRSLKSLGITKTPFHAQKERRRERYKKTGDRMRERYRKSRGLRKDGRKRRRRR